MSNKSTEFMNGKIHWAKIFGEPRMNYHKDGKEWTFELEPDKDGVAIFKKHKVADRLKTKDERNPYITLKQKAERPDGTTNQPIRVYGPDNEPWEPGKFLGNGTEVSVKLSIIDFGVGKKKGVYPVAIKVRKHVPYTSTEFGAMDGDLGEIPEDNFMNDLDDDLAF